MKVTRVITVTKEVNRCFHECPYFSLEGHEMVCDHPDAPGEPPYKGLIIQHPQCDEGFPPECPLTKPGAQLAPKCMCGCDCLPCQSCDHK